MLADGHFLLHIDIHWPRVQAAAVEVAASYPGGIDYLVVNAGTNDNHVKPTLELYAASPFAEGNMLVNDTRCVFADDTQLQVPKDIMH